MTDEDDRRSAPMPTFEELRRMAAELQEGDFDGAAALIRIGRDTKLAKAQLHQLMRDCEKSTGFDYAVIRDMLADLETEHPVHGRLPTIESAVSAFRTELEQRFGPLLYTDGSIHAYQAHEDTELHGIFVRVPLEELGEWLMSYPRSVAGSGAKRREIVARLCAAVRHDDAFSEAPAGLALASGFLLFDPSAYEFEHVPHSPDHLARNRIDVAYNPEARAPKLLEKLRRSFGGDRIKVQAYLEFLACAVFRQLPENDPSRTCLTMVGSLRSGKSTLIQLSQVLFLDEQLASLTPDLWPKPENLLLLASCALNTVTELQARHPIRGHIVKQVLSHEPVAARRMRQNLFTFTPRCLNIWACNELPRFDEQHPSLLRRFLVLAMGETLTDAEAADAFQDTLHEEAEGFVNLLAESFMTVMRRGRFVVPPDSDLLVGRMQFGDQIAPLFARHHLLARPGARATTEDLQRALRAFASSLGMESDEAVHSGTMKELAGIMAAQFGAVRKKANGRPFYLGVALRDEPPLPARDVDEPEDGTSDLSGL